MKTHKLDEITKNKYKENIYGDTKAYENRCDDEIKL
jgi:hypothetical protein